MPSQCGDVYFSEVLKEVTIRGEGAGPGCEYNLEMQWTNATPSNSWTQNVSVIADSQGKLQHEVTVPAKIHSQGNLVSDEHILVSANFTLVKCMEISGDSTVCIDDSYPITLSVSGGTAPYSWSSSNTSQAIVTENNPDSTAEVKGQGQSGSVTITVTDANGCTATKSINVTFDNISNVQELNNCTNKIQAPGNPTYNGCGPSGWKVDLVPDCVTFKATPLGPTLGTVCFEGACNGHDIGYATCNKSKSSTDTAFHNAARWACELRFSTSSPNDLIGLQLCYTAALGYYAAVSQFGGGPYQSAQIDNCVCCD